MAALREVPRFCMLVAAGLLCSCPTRAQPATSADVWFPTGLSQNTCLQRAQDALRRTGFQNVKPTVNNAGMAWAGGTLGEYSFLVACINGKDVIVGYVAGPDSNMAKDYLQGVMRDVRGSR